MAHNIESGVTLVHPYSRNKSHKEDLFICYSYLFVILIFNSIWNSGKLTHTLNWEGEKKLDLVVIEPRAHPGSVWFTAVSRKILDTAVNLWGWGLQQIPVKKIDAEVVKYVKNRCGIPWTLPLKVMFFGKKICLYWGKIISETQK